MGAYGLVLRAEADTAVDPKLARALPCPLGLQRSGAARSAYACLFVSLCVCTRECTCVRAFVCVRVYVRACVRVRACAWGRACAARRTSRMCRR